MARRAVKGPLLKRRKAIYRRSTRQRMPAACFLKPRERKYPICPARAARTGRKVVDCRLVNAAASRAAQHGHTTVLRKARALQRRYGCTKATRWRGGKR